MENMQTQELISALADGQLQGQAFAMGVQLAASDPLARQAWQTYHLIGDVLRSGESAAGTTSPAFLERLQARLRLEKPLPAPDRTPAVVVQDVRPEAANDSSFRWKLVAGLASVAAVGAIAWSLAGVLPGKIDSGQLARSGSGTVLTAGERGVMIRDPQLDELLAAHRQLGGASALQMSGGFVRNAAFDGSNR